MTRHRSGAPDVLQVRDLACRRGPALLFSGISFEVAGGELSAFFWSAMLCLLAIPAVFALPNSPNEVTQAALAG